METHLCDMALSIIGKTKDEIAQMCKKDSFLNTMVEDYWSPPYTENLEYHQKHTRKLQDLLNTLETDLVKIYDLLNPSAEFLTAILHAIQNHSFRGDGTLNDFNPQYDPYEYANLKDWIPLLKKITQPQFNNFSNNEKIELLLGPILLFIPETDFIHQEDLDAIANKYHLKSGNLTTLLCEIQKTLFVPPQLYRFAFAPIKDEYDRALLRLTAFTDAIIAVRDYLIKSDQQKFDAMSRVGLTNFTAVVNWWHKKTWPEVRNELAQKRRPLADIIPIMQTMAQNFMILSSGREEFYIWANWDKKTRAGTDQNYILSDKEYQTAFRYLLLQGFSHGYYRLTIQDALGRIPNAFTPEKFDKLKDDQDFFDWVFMERYMGYNNISKETVYAFAGGIDFGHQYLQPRPRGAYYNLQILDQRLSALTQKYKLLQPSEQLLKFVAKLAKEK